MKPFTPEQWQSISAYLDQALELQEPERTQWLAALAQNDPAIAELLSGVLADREQKGFSQFLAGSIPIPLDNAQDATLIGRQVGPYVIEADVGRGGMGSVWRARRADGRFEGKVAVKFVHAVWIGRTGEQRFLTEGKLLGHLHHPNIARLLDAGVLDASQPYLVIEYVEGEPIDAYCDRHGLGVEDRIKLFLDVLAAVAHAHSHLIVHRDLKPANIYVTRDGVVKLLDFGIAKLLDDATGAAALTQGGTALTPQFAAPEQLLGEAVTTATDVYSVGLVLYLLLTGRHPILAGSESNAQLIHAVLTGDAPQASSVSRLPTPSRRLLQGDLDNILGKALKKVPAERYASVGAFAEDLKRHLTHEPVKACADTATYRFTKFVKRHRGGVMSALLSVLVLCAATVTTFLQKLEADRQRDAAQFEARRAESSKEFLNLLLLSDGGSKQASLSPAERIGLGAKMLELQYRDDPRFAGRMLVELGNQYEGQTATRQAVALDTRAYELGKAAHDPELMALAQCAAADAEASAGIVGTPPQRIAEAQQLIARLDAPSVVLQVDCRLAEAELAVRQGKMAAGEQILEGARRLLEESGQTYRAVYTTVLNDLGGIYNETRRLAQALAMAELNGATHEKYGRGGTTARLITLQNEAVVRFNIGEIKASMSEMEDVRRRRLAIQGDDSEPLSMTIAYADRLVRLGRLQEGLDLARTASIRARNSGNTWWMIAALRAVCIVYIRMGQLSEAESTIHEIATASGNGSNIDRHFLGLIDRLRGLIELKRGDPAAALQSANASLASMADTANGKTLDERESLNLAARAALALGRPADAEHYARQMLSVAEAVARGPDTSADVGEALLLLAKAEIAQGRSVEGQSLLTRASSCLTNGLGADHALTREALELSAHNLA